MIGFKFVGEKYEISKISPFAETILVVENMTKNNVSGFMVIVDIQNGSDVRGYDNLLHLQQELTNQSENISGRVFFLQKNF